VNFRGARGAKKVGPRIEMTPMIDVVFLLLIFLLVSTQFKKKQHAFKVPLPKAGAVEVVVQPNVPVVIVQSEGSFAFLNPDVADGEVKAVNAEELKQQLEAFAKEHEDVSLRVRCDKKASYQSVVDALDIAKKSGIANVFLEAEKNDDGEGP
jgi:biopolymer transport protein ExbD